MLKSLLPTSPEGAQRRDVVFTFSIGFQLSAYGD
jgi:hypothetical protein